MRVLVRACLWEAGRWFALYAAGYLLLIAVAFAAPLVSRGAPLDAVLLFLPNQMAFFSVIALPLALVTALLATVGRMREEGELTALQAAGVSTVAVARALLPLALVLALALSWAVHWLLPGATLRLFNSKSDLLRQGIATQVARKVPIVEDRGLVVAALDVDGQRLDHVFMIKDQGEGRVLYGHARTGRWLANPEWEGRPELGAALDRPVLMMVETPTDRPDAVPQLTTAMVEHHWAVGGSEERKDYSADADVLGTPELWRRLRSGELRKNRGRLRSTQYALHQRLLLPVAALAYWSFACGLGLAIGRGNRLVAVCLGLLTVVLTLMPSAVVARAIPDRLAFHPGWLLWPPVLAIGLLGAWLLRRHR